MSAQSGKVNNFIGGNILTLCWSIMRRRREIFEFLAFSMQFLPFRAFCVESPKSDVCSSVCLSVCLSFRHVSRSDLLLDSKSEETFAFSSKANEKVGLATPNLDINQFEQLHKYCVI